MDPVQMELSGWFRDPLLDQHINVKEAEAAFQGVVQMGISNCQLHLYLDNTTLFGQSENGVAKAKR